VAETTFQPMPDLSPEQYDALKADIRERGVLVPVVVDQHDRVLDGHNRRRIADEVGIDCPTETKVVADDDEAADLAVVLNCARRHLNREQVRQVIANEIERRSGDSDRAIARRVGCSPSTVGTIRRTVSNLDTSAAEMMTRAEAEEITNSIRDHLTAAREAIWVLIVVALSNNIAVSEIVTALTRAHRTHEQRRQDSREVADVFRTAVFGPLIDLTLAPATAEEWRPQWDHETFLPLTPDEQAELLADLAGVAG